jgi:hypothetical protein
MIGWMRWYAERPNRPGSADRAITCAAASALRSKYTHHSATTPANATTNAPASAAETVLRSDADG